MWRCFVRDQARVPSVAGAVAPFFVTGTVFFDYRFAREQDCDLRLFDFESFGGFGKEVRSTLREAANQLSNKLSHAQHLDEVTWTTKNWHGLQMQRLSVVLHTAVAWQTVNELACGESGIVHGAECIAVLNGVA